MGFLSSLFGGSDGGSSSTPATQTNISQTTIPDYAKPYVEGLLGKAQALTDITKNPYVAYPGERTAAFTDLQNQAFQGAGNLGPAGQLSDATNLAQQAGLGALNTNYQAGQFQNQFQAPGVYSPLQAAYNQVNSPNLQQYQMGPAERVRTESFRQPGAAQAFMSPYMQNVVDVQQREARRASDIAGQAQQAEAVGRGAFGGSRDALMRAERQRNLATQLGDIQATGLNTAYNQAQQQFNAEQNARLQAQQANQQAGLTTSIQNLNALLGVQQLGSGQNLQAQLANQQAGLSAQQLAEQSRQFGAGQELQAANLGAQYGQSAQQLGEQSRQFGAGLGLQGLQTALQGAGALGNLGATQFGQQAQALGLQGQMGGVQQQQQQNILNQQYQDFLNQKQYPYQQLSYMSDMLRGLPLSQTTSSVYANPSMLSQVAGLGTAAAGAYGMYKGLGGGKKGGTTKEITDRGRPAGLMELALHKMA